MPYAYGDYILTFGEIPYQSFGLDKKRTKRLLRSFFGWGAGIRTPEMSESESDALPLGDTPIFGTRDIIANTERFVNTFFEKSFCRTKILAKTLPNTPLCGIIFPLRALFMPAFHISTRGTAG